MHYTTAQLKAKRIEYFKRKLEKEEEEEVKYSLGTRREAILAQRSRRRSLRSKKQMSDVRLASAETIQALARNTGPFDFAFDLYLIEQLALRTALLETQLAKTDPRTNRRAAILSQKERKPNNG